MGVPEPGQDCEQEKIDKEAEALSKAMKKQRMLDRSDTTSDQLTMCPDGTYVKGDHCTLAPDGTYR